MGYDNSISRISADAIWNPKVVRLRHQGVIHYDADRIAVLSTKDED
jgi:hypothetical protein